MAKISKNAQRSGSKELIMQNAKLQKTLQESLPIHFNQ